MDTAALKDLLATRLGLDTDTLDPHFLSNVAHWGLQHSGHRDMGAFVREAAADDELWQRLMENVVVAETWFFRDTAPFEHIVETVRSRLERFGSVPIRVFSCPCSTGEEAFSVAIALTKAGIPSDNFTIDAADVSPRAIRAAEAGLFRSRSFRASDAVDRESHFDYDSAARAWRVKPAFRKIVRFRIANFVSSERIEESLPYDIVLCRNLLIYLHEEARASVMKTLKKILAPTGLLIVGHAESGIAREHGFVGIGNPKAFAFVKASAAANKLSSGMRGDGIRLRRIANGKCGADEEANSSPPAVNGSGPPKTVPTLESIRQLGDAGRLEQAIQACHEYMTHAPDSAEGHFLLGVLCGAIGQEREAEAALRRVLYLQPNHGAALIHLALVHDARGDTVSAAKLRERAMRSQAGRREP